MKRLVTTPLLLAMLFIVAFAAGDKRFTIEDALAMKTVSAPQWSPDGKRIAYAVSEWDRKENRRVSHIYLVTTDGGKSVKLTNGEKGENAPQWSPDGTRIAFLADRDKGAQIWLIPADGGEAEKLTNEENGISSFRWSPDGKQIAFITRDTPKDKAAREQKKKDNGVIIPFKSMPKLRITLILRLLTKEFYGQNIKILLRKNRNLMPEYSCTL